MKKVSIVAKERRSSVGFFDFVRFRVFRGFLDGGVTAKPRRSRRGAKKREFFWFEAKRGARGGGAEEDAVGGLEIRSADLQSASLIS